MSKEREILQMFQTGMSQRNIALGLHTNIHMVQFFGGAARLLIPDNLKTGIVSNRKHEDPVVNQSYKEFAEHYHTAILPARVLAPKDKAAVEGNVGNVTS